MRINTNVPSLQAQRQLSTTTRALQRAMERLASGRRINSAKDDAAGLAISEGLRAQVRGLGQVARNINDAMGLLLTVDGVLESQIEITQRMRELAVQASTGTLSSRDRANLDIEFQTLLQEFDRISSQANFNGVNLLDGSLSEMNIQVGNNKGEVISFGIEDSRSAAIFTDIQGSSIFAKDRQDNQTSTWIKAGDLNNDRRMDYLHRVGNQIFSMINNGDGTFTKEQTINFTGGQASNESTAMGDFNHDGHLDFVMGTLSSTSSTIYIGDGTGHFTSGGALPEYIDELDAGDVNGDGIDDLVSVSVGLGTLSIRLGQENGSFLDPILISPTGGVDIYVFFNGLNGLNMIDLADFTGDGVLDIAYHNNQIVDIMSVNASGTFTTVKTFFVSDSNGGMMSGDFDGDGLADIAFGAATNDTSEIYLNQGMQFEFQGYFEQFVDFTAAQDINGDGHIDLVGENGHFYLGRGNGTFEKKSGIELGSNVLADFNQDGILDYLDNNTTSLYLQGNVEVSAAQPLTITSANEAQRMLEIMSNAIENLVSRRASIGALMSRLDSAENVSLLTRENLSAAYSQVMDADIAYETAELTKQQFLQQAAVSVLSQANISLQIVLKLLKP